MIFEDNTLYCALYITSFIKAVINDFVKTSGNCFCPVYLLFLKFQTATKTAEIFYKNYSYHFSQVASITCDKNERRCSTKRSSSQIRECLVNVARKTTNQRFFNSLVVTS